MDLPFLIEQANIERRVQEEGKRLAEQQRARDIQRKQQQGLGRPIVSAETQGVRFIAVGGQIYHDKWRTFYDFLGNYIKRTMGEDWGTAELKKPFDERHPVLKWYQNVCTLQREHAGNSGQVHWAPMNGAASAYYRLAYNLYLIAHNGSDIQSRLVSRLRNIDNFHGHFFETQVAAWMIKAGFELEFENESDGTTSHCEFTATYAPSGGKFSVEAKSRFPSEKNASTRRLKIASQLRKALHKKASHSRLVFLDLNQPIQFEQEGKQEFERAQEAIERFKDRSGENYPPAYVCITNISDHYFLDNQQIQSLALFSGFKIEEFVDQAFPSIKAAVKARKQHSEIFALMRSMKIHVGIPTTFDGGLPATTYSADEVTRMRIGNLYRVPDVNGHEVVARLTTASVDPIAGTMYLGFYDEKASKSWISTAPMTEAEREDYKNFPDTFFDVYVEQGRRIETALEFFDFFHETYRETPKEKLIEWMANAPDIRELVKLTQEELSEVFCERMAYKELAERASAAAKPKRPEP